MRAREEKFERLVNIKGGVGVLANNVIDRDERIAELEAAIRAYGNQFYADLLDTQKLNQARHDLFALVRKG